MARVRLTKPNAKDVHALLSASEHAPHSYEDVGSTCHDFVPAGFTRLHHRERVGHGNFDAAIAAMQGWRFFPTWVDATANGPLRAGTVISVVAQALGVWTHNVCRIVYVIDEPDRYGFGYGTLGHHVECGEERFLVEREGNNDVVYDVYSFSRPAHMLAVVGRPIARSFQRRFLYDSAARLKAYLQSGP